MKQSVIFMVQVKYEDEWIDTVYIMKTLHGGLNLLVGVRDSANQLNSDGEFRLLKVTKEPIDE